MFQDKRRTHVLMITNHGVHEWKVVPGLQDTGGQNVYVNEFTKALVEQGYRVTIVNRGGYPHPVTKEYQTGVRPHESGHARILYLEDGNPQFVRKEDMNEQLPALAEDLRKKLSTEDDDFDLIISHYWDGGKLGTLVNQGANRRPHVWVPHSLGALKKQNMEPETWGNLRIDERIAHEKELLRHVDGAVATSSAISTSFREDYGVGPKYFLPPCIDAERIRPLPEAELESTWQFLAGLSDLPVEELRRRKLVTEISRTDKTKRKDILIHAFARVKAEVPDALLAVSIDQRSPALYDALQGLIREHGLERDVIVLGSVWNELPGLYNATSVYCTPSVMEGFGMSAQEAAATGKPVVASNLVPFVVEYLLGAAPESVMVDGREIQLGEAGAVVPADFVEGVAAAISALLRDQSRAQQMGRRALEITIPYFTWHNRTHDLMEDLRIPPRRALA